MLLGEKPTTVLQDHNFKRKLSKFTFLSGFSFVDSDFSQDSSKKETFIFVHLHNVYILTNF